jgi:type II secretory pathway pseudopilin PulG
VLIGLLLPAIQYARIAAQRAQAMADISQLSVAIGNAKTTMEARYVPGADPTTQDYIQFFGTRFTTSTIPTSFGTSMTGNQSLVFFLGGYQSGPPATYLQGFSNNSPTPFSSTPPMRPPFFDFPANRLQYHGNGPPFFLDPWGSPYFYMTTKNGTGDYPVIEHTNAQGLPTPLPGEPYSDLEPVASKGSVPFFVIPPSPLPNQLYPSQTSPNHITTLFVVDASGKAANFSSFQIVSPGLNKFPGPGGSWTPGSGSYVPSSTATMSSSSVAGGDDLSNFYPKQLGTP